MSKIVHHMWGSKSRLVRALGRAPLSWRWVHRLTRAEAFIRYDIWWPLSYYLWGRWFWKPEPEEHPSVNCSPHPAWAYRKGKRP